MVETVVEEGNTKPPRQSASKYWCFTWNNYPAEALSGLVKIFIGLGYKYIIGKEVGESGTPHLQGYVESDHEIRWSEFKLSKDIHWEKRKGNKAQNIKYCSKEGNFETNFEGVPRGIPLPMLTGWQLKCSAASEVEPLPRDIYWYWSNEGGRGKSTMVRWLAMKGAIVCAGKAADMKYQIVRYIEKHGHGPKNVVFDVPRSAFQYLSYTGIEEIKNGVFASSKYESDMVIMSHPNVFVFCNFEPDYNNHDLSVDRLKVVCVDRVEGGNGGYDLGLSSLARCRPEDESSSLSDDCESLISIHF